MSKVKVELNRAGVRELLRSEEVGDMIAAEAQARCATLGDGYSVNTRTGRNRVNAEILAETYAARRDNLKNNTLLRAIS